MFTESGGRDLLEEALNIATWQAQAVPREQEHRASPAVPDHPALWLCSFPAASAAVGASWRGTLGPGCL